jgi:hypothetical protein
MFRRLRTSQKQRQHSQRHTYKQRGGAPWYQIPASRAAEWAEPLRQIGISAIPNTDRDIPTKRMDEYFMALEKQDELFDIAIKLIAAKLGLPAKYSASDIARIPDIDAPAKRTEMLAYVDDVEQLVNLAIDRDETDTDNLTKLQEIRSAGDEPLSTLLLFPKRLNNVFVQSLANILIVLKADQSILRDAALNPTMTYAAAVQYDANVRGNAYFQTSRNLRDGFYMSQGKSEFNKEIALVAPVVGRVATRSDTAPPNFWVMLLQELAAVNTLTEADIFKVNSVGCLFDIIYATWAKITAHVFLAYKFNKIDNILQFFKDTCTTTDPPADDPERPHIPNKAFDKVDIRGTTFEKLLSNMGDTTLQYILHLAYTIRKNEATVLQELGAAS